MVTLRILLTGLIAYGPMLGINEETPLIWALMADASHASDPHVTQLRLDCDSDGVVCGKDYPLKGSDLRILINDQPLVANEPLRIDHTFREYVGDLREITGNNVQGHHACSGLVTARALPVTRKPLEPHDGLLNAFGSSSAPANLDKVASRLRLVGGFPMLSGACDGTNADYCGGRLSARDVAVCGRWKFSTASGDRCARLADTVVYELRIKDDAKLKFAGVSHSDGTTKDLTEIQLNGSTKTVEVWVVNAPEQPVNQFGHFNHLYGLLKRNDASGNLQLPYATIPEYDENSISQCQDLPGLKPVKCPGMMF